MADRESILRWLNEKRWRIVRPGDPARRICDRLVAERKAIVLRKDCYAVTVAGLDSLCPPGIIVERRET